MREPLTRHACVGRSTDTDGKMLTPAGKTSNWEPADLRGYKRQLMNHPRKIIPHYT